MKPLRTDNVRHAIPSFSVTTVGSVVFRLGGSPAFAIERGKILVTRVFGLLFFEQYSHEPAIAVARNIRFRREAEQQAPRLAKAMQDGRRALDVRERRLSAHDWLTDFGPTIADLALFAYTQVADEGGFELAAWPGITAWIARVRALPGIVLIRAA